MTNRPPIYEGEIDMNLVFEAGREVYFKGVCPFCSGEITVPARDNLAVCYKCKKILKINPTESRAKNDARLS